MRAVPARRVQIAATLTVAAATLAAATLAACSSSGSNAAGDPGTTSTSSTATTDAKTVTVTITAAHGCEADSYQLAAGGVTFNVTNKDATAVSEIEVISGERIVGERENIVPGLSGSFSVSLDAGKYTLYCPGATKERQTLTASGKGGGSASTSVKTLLAAGTKQWATYVTTQVGYLVQTAQDLATALHGTDLAAAQAAYMKARPYYEKIEPVAESFVTGKSNLDANIDARAGDVPASQWQGFHRIEKGLFEDRSLKGLGTFGDGLVTNTKKLQSLTKGLTYQPFELLNGAQDLLNEVATSKVTGEEERYSLIDLLDFQANDEGAEQAFAVLQPALEKLDASTTAAVASSFDALNTLVDSYRTGANPSGFVLYDKLTKADVRKLAAAVATVQEPLAKVAKTVANS